MRIVWFSVATAAAVLLIVNQIFAKDPYNDSINFTLKKSDIAGNGIFSNKFRYKGEVLFKAAGKNKISVIGSKVNHCWNPNSKLVNISNSWWLVADKNIEKGEEVTANYNNSPSFIKKPNKSWTC
jgi:SET domain-containing protein